MHNTFLRPLTSVLRPLLAVCAIVFAASSALAQVTPGFSVQPVSRGGTGTTTGSITAPATTDLTFTAGSSGATLTLGQGATGVASFAGGAGGKVRVGTAANFPTTEYNRWVSVGTSTLAHNVGYVLSNSDGTNNMRAGFSLDGTNERIIFTGSYSSAVAPRYSWRIATTPIMELTFTGNLLIGGTTDITGSGGLKVFGTTDATDTTSGVFQSAGGGAFAKKLFAATFGSGVEAKSGAGALDVVNLTTKWTTTAADAGTLADGVNGQLKIIVMVADGGDGTLTPATKTGFSTITFDAVGDAVTLQFFTTLGWMVVSNVNATLNL